LVLWDHRATMHRGMPFDEQYARDLQKLTTTDLPAEAIAAA
jgi:hypothetical protein